MFDPLMLRPDAITRSGTIQPFSVRTMDPVAYARDEVDPFIAAIRPQGSYLGAAQIEPVRMVAQNALGIARASTVPLAAASAARVRAFGALPDGSAPYLVGLGALAVGALAGFFFGRRR